MKFFEDSPEKRAIYAEESLIFDVTESLCEALERRGVSRKDLAAKLGVSPAEITHRLRGTRNLTLRSVARMFHELGYRADITVTDMQRPAAVGTFTLSGTLLNTTTSDARHATYTGPRLVRNEAAA